MVLSARRLAATRDHFRLEVAAFDADFSGTAVLGPNGAGKTTMLAALQGLIRSGGTIDRPSRCAGVFASPAVFRGTTLWNVSAVLTSVLGVTGAEATDRAHAALVDVGLVNEARYDARKLSVGQRQRLALGRALAVQPDALFLDEAFANIDADGRPALRALVRSYVQRSGCALTVATSSLADAVALCASGIVLRDGRVVAQSSLRALRDSPEPYVAALLQEAEAHTGTGAERGR